MKSTIAKKTMTVMLAASLLSGTSLGVASMASASVSSYSVNDTSAPVMDSFQKEIFDLTNNHRIQNGVAPLKWSNSITTVSQNWTNYQLQNNQWKHNPNFANEIPAGWTSAGENIAANMSAEEVFVSWVNSEGHNANLLNPSFTEMGLGYGFQDNQAYQYPGTYYVTQNFGGYPSDLEPDAPVTQEPTTPAPEPTVDPTTPAPTPTEEPTTPAPEPTVDPTTPAPEPTVDPTTPAPEPTVDPTTPAPEPTVDPTTPAPEPTVDPTTPAPEPTVDPTTPAPEPTVDPTTPAPEPTVDPTTPAPEPTVDPTTPAPEPTVDPTTPAPTPTEEPTTPAPTTEPTNPATQEPTTEPTAPSDSTDAPINFTEENQGDLTGTQTGDWTIVVGNLQPNTAYDFVLHSTPTTLGTLTTDASGSVTVNVPNTVANGVHHLAVYPQGAIAANQLDQSNMVGWVSFEVSTVSDPTNGTNNDPTLSLNTNVGADSTTVTPYENCDAPGADNVTSSDPRFTAALDRDGDGLGCETDTNGDGVVNEDDLAQTAVKGDNTMSQNLGLGAIASFLMAAGLFVFRGGVRTPKAATANRKH